jgi:hypothetical protein
VSQPWPAPAGSRTNETTPGRARRSRVCTSVMGLSLSSGASATSSGPRARPMAMFAVSRSPSLRSKRAGESATQPLISTTTQDPIATAPRRRHRPRRLSGHRSGAGWRTAVATSAACRLPFSPVGQLELPVQRRSNSKRGTLGPRGSRRSRTSRKGRCHSGTA